jgi:hypothetical protein
MTDREFEDYWAYLVEKKHSANAALSSDERLFYATNVFRGSVPRSGLIGYFENTECDVIRDAHHALAALGLHEVLKLLQDAQSIVLNGHPLPDTDQCPVLFDYDLPEADLVKAMDDLDERVGAIQKQLYLQDQPIFDALCRFAGEKNLAVPKG